MIDYKEIQTTAKENYSHYDQPEDKWHTQVEKVLFPTVCKSIKKYTNSNSVILNAGSGGEDYPSDGKMIQLDICEENIKQFDNYIVASVENVPLESNSINMIICVGSVLNYVDADKTIKEFHRILKENGILILEFERSDSADFKGTNKHHADTCEATYEYQNQKHKMIMYGEKYIQRKLNEIGFNIIKKKRFHILSSKMCHFGMEQENAAKFRKFDWLFPLSSYSCAHNIILILRKVSLKEK